MLADDRVRGLLFDPRQKGWLDWHLITEITSVATLARAQQLGRSVQRPSTGRRSQTSSTKEIVNTAAVPVEKFTSKSLRDTLATVTLTVEQRWDSRPTQTSNLYAWIAILRDRYGSGTDDVPHRDILSDDVVGRRE